MGSARKPPTLHVFAPLVLFMPASASNSAASEINFAICCNYFRQHLYISLPNIFSNQVLLIVVNRLINGNIMQTRQILENIINSEEPMPTKDVLDLLLPPIDKTYSIQDIDNSLKQIHGDIEDIQRDNNDNFDQILDESVQEKLKNLCQDLHKTQLDIMKLQCDIAYTREQYDTVKNVCNSKVVQDRRELLEREQALRKSLQQSKFRPAKEFYDRFIGYLDASVATCRQMVSYYASNYLQTFDWGQYHQCMFFLRACGRAFVDIDRFERLYQSDVHMAGITFKQPIDKLDMVSFIELKTSYTIESQVDVIVDDQSKRQEFGSFITNQNVREVLESTKAVDYDLFQQDVEKLRTITTECCRLLIDLNLNYIEAHFTEGINIDKLNGCDAYSTAAGPPTNDQALPSYAFSPQAYINQIGEHLLTLRKHTMQFDQADNRPIMIALDYLEFAQNIPLDVRSCKSVTEIILRCIARHCIRSLVGRTTNSILSKLTQNGRRQLATDASYLDNVLEDLGLLGSNEPNIEKFKSLLTP